MCLVLLKRTPKKLSFFRLFTVYALVLLALSGIAKGGGDASTSTSTPPDSTFIDEEANELLYSPNNINRSTGKQGRAGIPPYNNILQRAVRAGDTLAKDDVYCWQCVQDTYSTALELLPIPLDALDASVSPDSYSRFLSNPYATNIDSALLDSVVLRLNIASIRNSYAPYASTLTITPTYPIVRPEDIRHHAKVVLRQIDNLCGEGGDDAFNGYGTLSDTPDVPYCDYAKWVQLKYVLESVSTLLTSYPANTIAPPLVEFMEGVAPISASAVGELLLSSRGVQGLEVLKESLYGEMLRDYSGGRGGESYLDALTLQRLDMLAQPYVATSVNTNTATSVNTNTATATNTSYWQQISHTYAKESYMLLGLNQAPTVSLGMGCWLLSKEAGITLLDTVLNDTYILLPQEGEGDTPSRFHDGSVICFSVDDDSQPPTVLILNTNRPYQSSCEIGSGFGACLERGLHDLVAYEVLSMLLESDVQVFNHYQYSSVWTTMPLGNDASHRGGNSSYNALYLKLDDVFNMNEQALLLYITYQYLTSGNYIG